MEIIDSVEQETPNEENHSNPTRPTLPTSSSFTRVGEALVFAQTRARQADERVEHLKRLLKTVIKRSVSDKSSKSESSETSLCQSIDDALVEEDWDLLQSLTLSCPLSNSLTFSDSFRSLSNAITSCSSSDCYLDLLEDSFSSSSTNSPIDDDYSLRQSLNSVYLDVIVSLEQIMEAPSPSSVPPTEWNLPNKNQQIVWKVIRKFIGLDSLLSTPPFKKIKSLMECGHFLEIFASICAAFALGVVVSGYLVRKLILSHYEKLNVLTFQVYKLQSQLESHYDLFHLISISPLFFHNPTRIL